MTISIHAPRGRGDEEMVSPGDSIGWISIHAPRGRGDSVVAPSRSVSVQFQSTPLAGGATPLNYILPDFPTTFQSTPLAGGATTQGLKNQSALLFQSTPLAGGATRYGRYDGGADQDFNPRPSREGRRL